MDPLDFSNPGGKPRQSIFEGIYKSNQLYGDANMWSEVRPPTMPWCNIPPDQLPDVVRFTGVGELNDSFPHELTFHQKRKSDEFFARPSKIQATDEIMAAHMKGMSISKCVEPNGNISAPLGESMPDVNFNDSSVIPSLTVCPEIKQLPVFEPLMGIPRTPSWSNLNKSSKALVLWKPPKQALARFHQSLMRPKHCVKKVINKNEENVDDTAMED